MTALETRPLTAEQMTGRQLPCIIAVLGLGNLLRSDDGVGIHAIRRLEEDGRVPPGIEVIEGGTLGLDLLPRLQGITHLLVLDAVDTRSNAGTRSRFADAELDHLPVGKSVHLLGFADLLGSLRLLEQAPAKVVLLGVQPESTEWGVALSPAVNASLDPLLDAALAQISDWVVQSGRFAGTTARSTNETPRSTRTG